MQGKNLDYTVRHLGLEYYLYHLSAANLSKHFSYPALYNKLPQNLVAYNNNIYFGIYLQSGHGSTGTAHQVK